MNHKKSNTNGSKQGRENADCQDRYRFISKKGRPIVSASSLRGVTVRNDDGHNLGVLKDIMIDTDRGSVAYVVLQFEDDKSFALPYTALEIDPESMTVYVDIQREVFEAGQGMRPPGQKENN
ncbi:MAG: PRC-barrel domain-containing protein [Phycisphaerales bacterium JB063]